MYLVSLYRKLYQHYKSHTDISAVSLAVIIICHYHVAITLLNSSSTYIITESQDFFLDLTNYNKTSFPPVSDESGTWTLDGMGLSNDSIVTVTAYTITIKNITRNYTGRIFNITVSNMAGKRSEEFTVDVVCK